MNESLKERIAAQMDATQLLDFLNVEFDELIELLDEQIGQYKDELEAALR